VQQNNSNWKPQGSISAALGDVRAEANAAFPLDHLPSYSSANLASSVRFPGEDGGRSLAEMAQRDLDAALQLLADRAQYITGATGAAIALRRNGRNDMLCRASSGANAPELGALLSTEFGLSGESVRTRQALRCDDAERDSRVNHEVCRQMGIASVVVMPVVDDDEVLGVFELFSGKANAFGARDVSAVQRLSEMVETAVRLARASEKLPEQLRTSDTAVVAPEDQVLDGEVMADVVLSAPVLEEPILEEAAPAVHEVGAKSEVASTADVTSQDKGSLAAASEELRAAGVHTQEAPQSKPLSAEIPIPGSTFKADEMQDARGNQAASAETIAAQAPIAASPAETLPAPSPESASPKNKLFWSAAASAANDAAMANQVDSSHVPPMLRGLQKCEACGFPVSAGRSLCVECEEKKWKGRLSVANAARPVPAAGSVVAASPVVGTVADSKVEANAVAEIPTTTLPSQVLNSVPPASKEAPGVPAVNTEAKEVAKLTTSPALSLDVPVEKVRPVAEAASDGFVFSAGIAPSQSWLAANKYILGGLLLAVAVVLVIVLLR
jgi:hypothetical protein